jgi:hypothetical protein
MFQYLAVVAVITGGLANSSYAGTFKTITIDGSFGDWAGVPVAFTQDQSTTTATDVKNIYICNDPNYLYLRVTTYATGSPFAGWQNNIYFDGDNNSDTGYHPFFGGTAFTLFGSEMFIQTGGGFQEKNGSFNEGAIVGLDFLRSGDPSTDFEMRISRTCTYPDGGLVFSANPIGICFTFEDGSPAQCVPLNGSGGLTYTFATGSVSAALGPLSISQSGGNVTISWTGEATLQSESSLKAVEVGSTCREQAAPIALQLPMPNSFSGLYNSSTSSHTPVIA